MKDRTLKVIQGPANPDLVNRICHILNIDPVFAIIDQFSDGETRIEINENMRGCDVFVVQPTSPPANEHFMQLCLTLDALKRSNCWRITAVIPYYGYARQDKKLQPRAPISAKAVADMIQAVGIDRILTLDLHANQIQGYFNCPVDNLFASSIFCMHMAENIRNTGIQTTIVSPDVGGVARAVHYSKSLRCGTAVIHKTRSTPNHVASMTLLGDVRDAHAIIVDDMIDTAGTLCKAAKLLKENGAAKIEAYTTHGIFSGHAYDSIAESDFDTVYVTDSIKLSRNCLPKKIKTISCAGLIANAIQNIHDETSVSCLFLNPDNTDKL